MAAKKKKKSCLYPGSNQGPLDFFVVKRLQSNALPTELSRQITQCYVRSPYMYVQYVMYVQYKPSIRRKEGTRVIICDSSLFMNSGIFAMPYCHLIGLPNPAPICI